MLRAELFGTSHQDPFCLCDHFGLAQVDTSKTVQPEWGATSMERMRQDCEQESQRCDLMPEKSERGRRLRKEPARSK